MATYHHPMYTQVLSELRRGLSDRKFTQQQVAEKLGVTQAAISALLAGKARFTMDQVLGLCDLLGVSLQNVVRNAEVQSMRSETMSKEMESVYFKSEVHLICYCASSQEIEPSDLRLKGVTQSEVHIVLDDLVRVGLLIKRGKHYVQKSPNVFYMPSSKAKMYDQHFKVLRRSFNSFVENIGNKSSAGTKFNWCHIDRFTIAQIKELESGCWRLYEKFEAFQKQNATINYVTDEPMDLWNLHVMIMPVFS